MLLVWHTNVMVQNAPVAEKGFYQKGRSLGFNQYWREILFLKSSSLPAKRLSSLKAS